MSAYVLDGRVALVTGAGRGIGLEIARTLIGRGASVALVDLDPATVKAAAAELGEDRSLAIAADVTDAEAIGGAVASATERFGGLDLCVANAGISTPVQTVRATPPEAFQRVLEVNLLGTYRTARAALPHVVERRGHISLVASIYAIFNGALQASYGVSKAGIEALGRALRLELAPDGATVGIVYYGFVATEMVASFEADPLAEMIEREMPAFVRRRLSAGQAAETLVRGIESRSARVYAPRYLRSYSLFRGMLNPLIDRRLERHRRLHEVVRRADVEDRLGPALTAPPERR